MKKFAFFLLLGFVMFSGCQSTTDTAVDEGPGLPIAVATIPII